MFKQKTFKELVMERIVREETINNCLYGYDKNNNCIHYKNSNGEEYWYDSKGNIIDKIIHNKVDITTNANSNKVINTQFDIHNTAGYVKEYSYDDNQKTVPEVLNKASNIVDIEIINDPKVISKLINILIPNGFTITIEPVENHNKMVAQGYKYYGYYRKVRIKANKINTSL